MFLDQEMKRKKDKKMANKVMFFLKKIDIYEKDEVFEFLIFMSGLVLLLIEK